MNTLNTTASSVRSIPETRSEANTRLYSLGLLAGGIIILLLMEWFLFPLTVDDAYITYNYANNLSHGQGLVWHPGEDPVEGYTNFLWVITLSVFIKTGFDVVLVAKILGIIFSIGAVLVLYKLVRMMDKGALGMMPAILLAVTPAFALWSVSGLETSLFIFLMLLSLYSYLIEEREDPLRRRSYWSTLWLLLLGMTRPEGAIIFILLVAIRLFTWVRRPEYRQKLIIYLGWVIVIGIIGAVYFISRWMYFGYPLPNTFYVKAQTGLGNIARQIGVYLLPYTYRIFTFILLAIFALGTGKSIQKSDFIVIAIIACFVLVNLNSSDWMPGHRLILPITPLIFILARRPLETFARKSLFNPSFRSKLGYAILTIGLVFFEFSPILYTSPIFNRVMATQMDMSIYRWADEMHSIVEGQYVKIGNWLAENAPADCSVVAGNVGAIAYYSGCNVIDQIGLTNEHIARYGWTVDYLLGLDPDFIVIESDTAEKFGGLYGTGGERWEKNDTFLTEYELLFVIDNSEPEHNDPALFIHHLPHASWLFARKDLGLEAGI